ncbi:MAG: bifunctional diguanylate cyclase/phosphodiesterase [Gammaproteobacteria bacterium]|nr:bifunctional diguanylate cyclase/phosphodiesterase [Gammaproteobacteria bacterium]
MSKYQSRNSQLSGSFSRSRVDFFSQVEDRINKLNPDKEQIIFIRFDIDSFRTVNEDFGFEMGDFILNEISRRLAIQAESKMNVFYIGNGEYAIALVCDNKNMTNKTVSDIADCLKASFIYESHITKLKYSFGVTRFPGNGNTVTELMLTAESAKQHAKEHGGDQIYYFTNEAQEKFQSANQLKRELIQAIKNNEFFLVYQPKVNSTSGMVKGFEALIRWQHPVRGLVSPVEFIPVLEETQLITEVGDWVINEACAALKRWIDAGLNVVPVSVNVSTYQFKQEDFVGRLEQIINLYKIDPHLLEIEITESCLMDNIEKNRKILYEIKRMGLRISIDDFGTGYSSLSYLQKLPIDTLKIDRSFITNVDNRKESDNAGIVTAIMALSHSLRLDVVAEGVESARELAFLHALGCRTIQGFLFSKPLSEDAVPKLLKESECMQATLERVRQELQSGKLN